MKNGRQDLGERAHRGIYPAVVDAAMAWVEWSDTFTRASRMPNEAQMIATASRTQSSRESSRVVMGRTVRPAAVTLKRNSVASACLRIAELTKKNPKTVENLLNGDASAFAFCAVAIAVLLERGLVDEVARRVAVVDDALLGSVLPPLGQAQVEAKHADCFEDIAEADYDANPCLDTARTLYQRRAVEIFRQQKANAALRQEWGF
jgi:hypothetical protein